MPVPARPRLTGWTSDAFARVVRARGLGRRARAVAISVTGRLVLANAVAGLFVAAYLTLTEDLGEDGTWAGTIVGNALFYGIAVLFFSSAAVVRGKSLFADAWQWLDTDRPATDDETRALLAQPLQIALFPLRYWTAAAALSVVARLGWGADVGQVVVGAAAVLVGGLIAALVGFLLGERALRPVFALALQGRAPASNASLGIGVRLRLAWLLGSGVPLAGILATPLVLRDAELGVVWAMALLAVVGVVAGLVITAYTARSITSPLRDVRQALRRVGEGDLDVVVPVNDGGELGQLQAGVNEMVAGVRARVELEDLFSRHVGSEVARQALERGTRLGGKARDVSIVYVDLTGSTELAEREPPEVVVGLLNRFLAVVVDCCESEGGWVDKFEGDAALCVFGAPVDQPDHAARALRVARTLGARLRALRLEDPVFDAGIGVASGSVVAGHIGTEQRLEYTVIGSPVNTAARLTEPAKARPSRVLADDRSLADAGREARRWVASGTVDLKGLRPSLPVFEPAP